MPQIEIRNLTKRFKKGDEIITPVLDLGLDIEAGEFVALMGKSGTGKSTLLNLLAGIDRPDTGKIVIDGVAITELSRGKLADWRAAHLGYIFQTHNLVPVLTAYENIELPLLLLPMSSRERRSRVHFALEIVGLTDRAQHFPRQLSGGQEQRVGIARAVVAHPSLVVADEPTGNLDEETSSQIQTLLKELNRQLGITTIMVTHDAEVASIAGRQLRMEHGSVAESFATTTTPP